VNGIIFFIIFILIQFYGTIFADSNSHRIDELEIHYNARFDNIKAIIDKRRLEYLLEIKAKDKIINDLLEDNKSLKNRIYLLEMKLDEVTNKMGKIEYDLYYRIRK